MKVVRVALIVVALAVVQTATVVLAPTPGLDALFLLLAVVSFAATAAALAGATAFIAGRASRMLWIWTPLALLVVLAASAVWWPLLFAGVVLLLWTLPAAATGRVPFRGFGVFARVPVRAGLLTLGALLAVALLAVGALLAGFFLGEPVAAGLTWVGFGAVGALLVAAAVRLSGRVRAAAPADTPARPAR